MIVLDTNVLIEILKDNQSTIEKVQSFNCPFIDGLELVV